MKKLFSFQLIFFVFISLNLIHPQTVNEIINKHFQAVNQDQFSNLKTIVITSELILPGGKAQAKTYFKNPDKIRTEVTEDGKTSVTAFDGKIAWRVSPVENGGIPYVLGKESSDEDELMSILDGYFFCYKQRSDNVTLEGTEKLMGKNSYKIKCKTTPGDSTYIYMDTKTYLISKIEKSVKNGTNETYLSEYKKISNKMIFPFMFNIMTPFSRTFEIIKNIRVNVNVNNSLFTMPEQKKETKAIK
jgi:hypothetical protein